MTDAELKAYLKTLSMPAFQAMLQSAGAGTAQPFVDYNQAKLLSKYAATSGEGRAIRDAYELLSEGADPVDVAQRVIAAQAEYNISGDSLNEITGAIGDYAVNSAKFAAANPVKTNADALKELGMTELAPLLGALAQSNPKPLGIKDTAGDVSFQNALDKANAEIERLNKEQVATMKPGSSKTIQKDFSAFGKTASLPVPVPALKALEFVKRLPLAMGTGLGVAGIPVALGQADKTVDKQLLDVVPGDLADTPYTKEQFAKGQKLLAQKQEQEKQAALAKKSLLYQQSINKNYNDAYLKEFARLQAEASKKPSAFDIQRAAMLRALNG
jgi:hypothetical protein